MIPLLSITILLILIGNYLTLVPVGRVFTLSKQDKGVWAAHLTQLSCLLYLRYNPRFFILHDFNFLLLLTLNDSRVNKLKTYTWLITPAQITKRVFILGPTSIKKVPYINSFFSRVITAICFLVSKIIIFLYSPARLFRSSKNNTKKKTTTLISIFTADSYEYEWDMDFYRKQQETYLNERR